MRTSCYACGTPPGTYRQKGPMPYSIFKCAECGLEFTSPIPSDATLARFYATYRDIRAPRETVLRNARQNLKDLSRHGWTRSSKLLDFGTGTGVFLEAAGPNARGLEVNASPNPRVFSKLSGHVARIRWDFITLFGVLEHLPHPIDTLRRLTPKLRRGGKIVITTVDAEGTIPYHFKPPEHLTYWTQAAMGVLARRCGLVIDEYRPYQMHQLSKIYLDRLLARTPTRYRKVITGRNLPEVVRVPTNELFCVLHRR